MAQTLLKRMRTKATKLKSNKSVIDHSVPNEVLRMVLKPNWVFRSREHWGLGHEKRYKPPESLDWLLTLFLAKILATHLTPTMWHVADGFAVSKANSKPGILGERLVAACCPLGRLFYEICIDEPLYKNKDGDVPKPSDVVYIPPHERVASTIAADWRFGCVQGRRREETIASQQIHSFALTKAGTYHITTCFDGANAFWSAGQGR